MKKIVFTGLALFGLFACRVLEQEPVSEITSASFFKTAKDADAAILACYDGLQGEPVRLVVWGEGRADVYETNERSENNIVQIVNGNVDAANEGFNSWNGIYRGLNRINGVLKFVPGITDAALNARRERILGEAYFLRALSYFYLARTFDNAPLILEPYVSTGQDFFPTQAAPEQLYAQVEIDLLEAEKRLPDTYGNNLENRGRATRAAARTALADFYLWQKNYSEVIRRTGEVIASPLGYRLVAGAGYGSLFTEKNTSESIFELQYNNAYLEGNGNGLVGQLLPLGQVTPSYPGGNWSWSPSPKLRNAFAPSDLRRLATFQVTGTPSTPWRDADRAYAAKYVGTVVGPIRYQDANLIIYRLADVLLMQAEAQNELGQTASALESLNRVRTRAGLANATAATGAEIRLAIEQERFLELAFEGKRYFDLKRTGRYAAVTGRTDPNWLRWPVANSELLINRNLQQNPGY